MDSFSDLGMVKWRRTVVIDVILVSVKSLIVKRRDGSADVQAAKSCAVKVVTILKVIGRHPTGRR